MHCGIRCGSHPRWSRLASKIENGIISKIDRGVDRPGRAGLGMARRGKEKAIISLQGEALRGGAG